ncbi:unnamed protein product, partial [Iphiclides podalirius]
MVVLSPDLSSGENSSHGLEYNMLRVPIGGTDFSTHYYAYNEVPADDPDLTNYTLSYEDYKYKLPVIKTCMNVATSPVHIVGSVWSPPSWMKEALEIAGMNHLKSEYMQTYALYYLKFLQLYSENGVRLWAVTTTNEPLNNMLTLSTYQLQLGWLAQDMGTWILENLGPTIRNSSFKDVKILAVDDQRFSIPIWLNIDLCKDVVGLIDWNMCLDMRGGPNLIEDYVDSPIIVNAEKQEFYKQPMFYALGHFSKFLKRDSRRIEITNKTVCTILDHHDADNGEKIDEYNPDWNTASYDSVAFQTPNNTIVLIIHNSSRGLEYNMLRVPIGGTDFSTHYYAYNEVPADDPDLTNYTLSYEDYNYKLPVIKACMDVATSPVHIVGSVWSPPKWMKDPPEIAGVNHLKSKYLQTYALYHFKFLQLYSENGVPLWAITTTNEPLNGVLPAGTFQHLGWSAKEMGSWILDNLGPTIRNSSFKDVKILAVDDQRFSIPIWFNNVISQTPGSEKYIDGIAVHFYFDNFTPASFLKDATKSYPNIFVISTEASEGAGSKRPVVLGSWERAESYIIDILEDLCNDVVGWIDWNMCLDMRGGPNWDKNYVDSPIIVNAEKQEFYKQPMFYALGHFSKFVTRGSRRIEITNTTICKMPKEHGIYNVQKIDECNPDKNIASYDSVAFQTPNSTNVVIIHNRGIENPVVIKYGDKEATLQLEAASITTVEFPAEFND